MKRSFLFGFGSSQTTRRRASVLAARVSVEELEDRAMLSLSFTPQFPGQTTSNGGTVATGNTPIYLIFAGGSSSGFGFDGSLTASQITAAVDKIVASSYLSSLSEYGATTSAYENGTYVSNFGLNNGFSTQNLLDTVSDALNDGNGTLPEVDDTNVDGMYFVFTPPSIGSSQANAAGYHTYGSTGGFLDPDNAAFGWIGSGQVFDSNRNINLNAIDSITSIFSHELVESITDPQTSNSPGVTTVPPSNAPYYQNPGEVCDNEAQYYIGYEGDVAVQSIWSAAQGLFLIPGATNQSFPLSGGNLTLNGDQLGPTPQNDTITISNVGGGIQVVFNTDTVTYGPGQVTHIDVKPGTGLNSVTIDSLPPGVTISVDGSAGTTNLTVDTSPNEWHITGSNAGDVNNVITFTSIGGLTGGTGVDNFHLINNGVLSSFINGGAGANSLDYASWNSTDSTNLATGATSGIGGGFSNIHAFTGSPGTDSFTGPDGTNAWSISGSNSGSVSGNTFAAFENLAGRSGNDTFAFAAAGSVSGNVSGGFGADTLNYSALAGPITVNLQTGVGPGIGGNFFSIENVVGSASSNDTIIGPDAAWVIDGVNSGNVNNLSFSSFENLTGNFDTDTFAFKPGGFISGNLNGGAGDNTLDYSALVGPVTVNLQTSKASYIGGTFANINNLIGSAGSDTLVGPDSGSIFTLTGANSGDVNGLPTFFSFENLKGGADDDSFVFMPGGSVSGNIDGGGGSNTLDYSNLSTNVTIGLGNNTATGIGGHWDNINTFIGGSGINTIAGPDTDTTYTVTGHNTISVLGFNFGNFQSILGGAGDDTFLILAGGSLDGSIDGGGGTNLLSYADYVGDVIVNLGLQTATGTGGVSNIQNLIGGHGNTMFVGDAADNVFTGGSERNILIGGAGSDIIYGGASDNILITDSTIYDLDAVALEAIFKEWTRTDQSFEQRVAHLLSPGSNGLNGDVTLDKEAIVQDNAFDALYGGATLDWFISENKRIDTIDGVTPQDHVTHV